MLDDGTHKVVIDPFLTGNPMASAGPEELFPDLILVTHGHGDHIGDAPAISARTGAKIVATDDLAHHLERMGGGCIHMNIGGTYSTGFCRVKLLPAVHAVGLGGQSYSFMVEMGGHRAFHAGDTALFGDLSLIGDMAPIDIAMIPIGGWYTMDADDAALAVRMLKPVLVVPMHYNTFEAIMADPQEFKRTVEADTPARCVPLRPGEDVVLQGNL